MTLVQPGKTVYVVRNETDRPFRARIKAFGRGAVLASPTGQIETQVIGEKGNYEFALPPCTQPCVVHGEPRILIQPGGPQAVWLLKSQVITKLN